MFDLDSIPILTLDDASFSYGLRPALLGITIQIDRGEFVGIVGPNGSGKSTLLSLMAGILPPDSGSVRFEDIPVQTLSRRQVADRIAIVPQHHRLDAPFTVEQLVGMGRYAKRPPHTDAIGTALSLLDLEPFRTRPVTSLSGGERQRAVVAQALAQQPRLLLLDEPVSGLDVSHQLHLFERLCRLNHDQLLTIVCVLHDLNMAMTYARRTIVLAGGRIAADGETASVLTPDIISSVYNVRAEVHRYETGAYLTFAPHCPPVPGRKRRIHVVCGGGTGAAAIERLVDAGFSVTAGALNALDSDEVAARELGLTVATEAPFAPIGPDVHRQTLDLVRTASVVVVTDFVLGDGNRSNVAAVEEALAHGRPVVAVSVRGDDALFEAIGPDRFSARVSSLEKLVPTVGGITENLTQET